jgi:hypothetical protein
LHVIGSSPAKLWTTKPSGALSSSLIESESVGGAVAGPGAQQLVAGHLAAERAGELREGAI